MASFPICVPVCAVGVCARHGPLPPLATPIPDSPQEYHVGPLRWQEDTVVTYAMQEAQEGRRGNAVTTEAAQHVVEFRAVERTTLGQFWVRCALDGRRWRTCSWSATGTRWSCT